MSSLSDIELDRYGQRGASNTDAELETMTPDVAVAVAKKMLHQRRQQCKIIYTVS